ncbi:MAG TPA: DNA-3-methyladenine glycosylase [Nocardioides sp.]
MDGSDLDFLAGPPTQVAPQLLGATLSKGGVSVRITEVEAYDGADDPGSHAYRGRTPRNDVMFGPPGHLYTYFIYGMHVCANVVCRDDGTAGAVLIRAGEVVSGLDVARARRPAGPDHRLAQGPGRLCSALGIELADYGADLLGDSVRLEANPRRVDILPEQQAEPGQVVSGPRVGLRLAADRPWRFWIKGDPTVSTYRPAVVRRKRIAE